MTSRITLALALAGLSLAAAPGCGGGDEHGTSSTGSAAGGKSLATAFETIAQAVSVVAAGDTVLIRGGLYREGISVGQYAPTNASATGAPGKPITFGSYGDGEVVLDGSTPVTGWVKHGGSVWKAPVTFVPIAVVVDDVPLKQVAQGQGGSTAPEEGLAGVTPGSGKWFYDAGSSEIYADMGTTLGAGDPNLADIVVPNDVGDQMHVFFYGDHLVFRGLTIRGSGSNGVWGYGNHVTVADCHIKFNGKSGVSYQVDSGGSGNTDNAVLTSHVWHNVLLNYDFLLTMRSSWNIVAF